MKRILIIMFLIIGLNSFGQKVSIDTISLPTSEKMNHFPISTLKFPIIRTGNFETDEKLNQDLKNRFTGNQFPDLPTDSTIVEWADENIIFLEFMVTYNNNGLVSLNISAESCGAYCTMWTEYYTYSTITGKLVSIDEIIELTKEFRLNVISDKNRQYIEQKKELKEMFLDKESGLDKESYSWALENYEFCDNLFEINDFALHENYLQIIHECSFPRMIKNLTPIITLKYEYDEIKELLKIKN